MRHLIIGASGQIGAALLKILHDRQQEIIGTFNKTNLWGKGFLADIPPGKLFKLDITNKTEVERLIADINPDIIYIPAAQTHVDYCEENEEETSQTNLYGIMNVVNAVNNIYKKFDCKRQPLIIFYSSDYIFDGKDGPYEENHLPSPINVYGKQKFAAEYYVATQARHYIIIRTTGVFGPDKQKKNFVYQLINNLQQNKETIVPEDEISTPTYAPNLADTTVRIINNIGNSFRANTAHIVNVAGRNIVSRFKFAQDVAKLFHFNVDLIKPCRSEEIVRSAKRPLNSGLVTDKAESIIGKKLMSYIEGLLEMKNII